MTLSEPSGFAVRRNGSCLVSETDCGATVDPFRVCCPGSASCPKQYNQDCCPTAANCTQTLLQAPSCANNTWTLYNNGGYFCCAPGTIGYNATDTYSDGCASPGSPPVGAQLLSIVSAGTTATPTSSSNAASNTTSALPSSNKNSESDNSTSNTGAIAGGVVGGVAALTIAALLLFWIFRRRKNRPRSADHQVGEGDRDGSVGAYYEKDTNVPRLPDPNEADGAPLYEMSSSKQALQKSGQISELPPSKKSSQISELPPSYKPNQISELQ